jgi:predicted TIM-barrel enzyme
MVWLRFGLCFSNDLCMLAFAHVSALDLSCLLAYPQSATEAKMQVNAGAAVQRAHAVLKSSDVLVATR